MDTDCIPSFTSIQSAIEITTKSSIRIVDKNKKVESIQSNEYKMCINPLSDVQSLQKNRYYLQSPLKKDNLKYVFI